MATASRPLHPARLSVLIFLILGTVIFTILVIHASTDIRKTQDGDPNDPFRQKSLISVEGDVKALLSKQASLEHQLDQRAHARFNLDLELIKDRIYYVGPSQIAGTSDEDVTYNGRKYHIAESVTKLTRDLIGQSGEDLAKLQQSQEGPDFQTYPHISQHIADLQSELQAVLQRSNDLDTAFSADRERLTAQLDALNKEKEKVDKTQRNDYSVRATKIVQLEAKIRELLELKLHWLTELEPVGEVLQPNTQNHHVIISIGRDKHVFPGLILEVYQFASQAYVSKGMIEVIDVRDQISICRVTSETNAKTDPIAAGDQIGNPVFSPDRPKVFVLAGEFKRYNKADLAAFITATGGLVRDKLSPGVDFLVAGDRSDKAQDNAREYQVQAMTEDQLLKYVQTTFPASAANAAAAVH